MRKVRFLYCGPRAWLVWLNFLIIFVGLFPFFLEGLLWLLGSGKIKIGETGIPIMWVALVLLWEIGQIGYVVCVPFLISACILLMTARIPWKVKLVTIALDLSVCALLFWQVGDSRVSFKHGLLG